MGKRHALFDGPSWSSDWRQYVIALFCVIAATIIRVWFDPLFGEKFPYITYMFAIIFVAWQGGLIPSLLTMVVGFLSAFYYFASPRASFAVDGIDGQIGAVLYIATGLSSILFTEQMRAAEQRAKASAFDLQHQQHRLELEVQERKAAQEAYASLLRRIVAVQEEERRRISRELHDQCGQDLTAMHLALKLMETSLEQGQDVSSNMEAIQRLLDRTTKEIHQLAAKLRPATLDDVGLSMAVSNLLSTWSSLTGIATDYECHGNADRRLPDDVETALYRVLQEALTNVARHADTSSVNIVLAQEPDHVDLIVEDQGRGFLLDGCEAVEPPTRLGLLGMRERITTVGGSLEIESDVGAGTTIFARVPLTSMA